MNKFFQKNKIRLNDMLNDIADFTKKVYDQSSTLYTPASPWGQILQVLTRISQLIFYYIEDSITELNINTASRPHSIYGLARIAGHDPTRAISSSGDLYIVPNGTIPNMEGQNVIVRNYTKIKCKDNRLPYLVILGQDEMKINIFTEKKKQLLKIIQGEVEEQTFTGTGTKLQSFEVNLSTSKMTDHFFVNVFINSEKWRKYDSLYDIPKDGKGYCIKTGISSGIDIYFGNSYFGANPPKGSEIIIQYLISDGEAGNINQQSGVVFEFEENGYDEGGFEIDLNEVFSVGVETPISFGSNPEPTFLTRLLSPTTSRSYVLATTTNYEHFFEKFQYFSHVSAYIEHDVNNLYIDNIVYLLLVPDVSKRMRAGENYFTTPIDFFKLTDVEKFKIQALLEESGQKILTAIIKFISPQFKRYVLNIDLAVWSGYNKDLIRENIIAKLSEYFISFRRKDFLPKSDLIAIVENIDGVDSVSLNFVSENIENELIKIINNTSELLTPEEYVVINDISDKDEKISKIYTYDNVQTMLKTHFDMHGNIVLSKNNIPLIRGGWKDRYDKYYNDNVSKDKVSSVNINIVKVNPKNINNKRNKININNLRNS